MRTLLSVLLAGLLSGALLAQPKGVAPWPQFPLPQDWAPAAPSFSESEKEKLRESPLWNSALDLAGRYALQAKLPARADTLWRQPRRVITEWLEREHKLPTIAVATEHAVIVSALPMGPRLRQLSSDERAWLAAEGIQPKERLDATATAHLYALRYLRCEARLKELLGIGKPKAQGHKSDPTGHFGLRSRSEFYLFPTESSYREFCRHFFGVFGPTVTWWYEADTDCMIGCMHLEKLSDEAAEARFDGLIAHNFVLGWRGRRTEPPVWVACGLQHLFERLHPERVDTFTLNGTPEVAWQQAWRFEAKDWRAAVLQSISAKSARSFAELSQILKHVELPPELRIQSWSIVAWMIAQGPGKFRLFLDELQSSEKDLSQVLAQDRSFRRAFGDAMPALEAEWKAWIKKVKAPR